MLNAQLRALGLYAAPTLGDGNCLFRALSDQLYGTPAHHLQLRAEICNWIEQHKERYAPFVEDERGLDHHLSCMRQQGEYMRFLRVVSRIAHMAMVRMLGRGNWGSWRQCLSICVLPDLWR